MSKLFLTFDIEEWYHANYDGVDFSKYIVSETNLDKNTDKIIEICSKHSIKATCFILGNVAEKKPNIVNKLFSAGHEIASHGYEHKLIYKMRASEFKEDLKRSCDILENITGRKISGYRAPSWSVNKENLEWYYGVLEEMGIKYSSSIYPAKTFLYGIPDFPNYAHYPVIKGQKCNILEIPVPICNVLGMKIGFSGGFYFRLLPAWFIRKQIERKNRKGEPVFIYLHPREIDRYQPKLNLSLRNRLIHYWGIRNCEKKLDDIIKQYAKSYCKLSDIIK